MSILGDILGGLSPEQRLAYPSIVSQLSQGVGADRLFSSQVSGVARLPRSVIRSISAEIKAQAFAQFGSVPKDENIVAQHTAWIRQRRNNIKLNPKFYLNSGYEYNSNFSYRVIVTGRNNITGRIEQRWSTVSSSEPLSKQEILDNIPLQLGVSSNLNDFTPTETIVDAAYIKASIASQYQ